jgi:hypothetical protein
MRRQTSPVPARVRRSPTVYPFRTREVGMARQHRQHYMPICRDFMSKPSDGLEPSTPYLPWLKRLSAGRTIRASRPVSLDLRFFGALFETVTETPRVALRNPAPVPKTYPQPDVQMDNVIGRANDPT